MSTVQLQIAVSQIAGLPPGRPLLLQAMYGAASATPTQVAAGEAGEPVAVAFAASFPVHGDAEEIANAFVRLQLLEAPKPDKKKKVADPAVLLGEVELRLLHLVQGSSALNGTCVITGGELTVTLTYTLASSAPLMSPDDLAACTLLTLEPATLLAPPETWVAGEADVSYTLLVQLGDRVVRLVGATVAPPSHRVTGGSVPRESIHERDFVTHAQAHLPRIQWRPQTLVLREPELAALRQRLPQTHSMLVEVSRATGPPPLPGTSKGDSKPVKAKKGVDAEDEAGLCPGFAAVDILPLMYPGRLQHVSTAHVGPWGDGVVGEATGHTKLTAERLGFHVKQPVVKPSTSKQRKAETPAVDEATGLPPPDPAAIYTAARTHVSITWTLTHPLVARRLYAEAAKTVADMVPPRDFAPAPGVGAALAVDSCKATLVGVAAELLASYRQIRTKAGEDVNSVELRRQLFSDLTTDGRFGAIKEQLKAAVVRVAREKFVTQAIMSDPAQKRDMLSRLYVFLVKLMHESLNDTFAFDATDKPTSVEVTLEQLKYLAVEAEELADHTQAGQVHAQIVAQAPLDAGAWAAFGTYCLRCDDVSRAEVCLREAVALAPQDVHALLSLGVTVQLAGRCGEALKLLDMVTTLAPAESLAWAVRHIVCSVNEDKLGSLVCVDTLGPPDVDVYLGAARFLLTLRAAPLVEVALGLQARLHGPSSIALALLRARLFLCQSPPDVGRAVAEVQEHVLLKDYNNREAWLVLGDAHKASHAEKAMEAYEHGRDLPSTEVWADECFVQQKLGALYLADDRFADAKTAYLRATVLHASAASWLGVGVAAFRLGELDVAAQALAEANVHDSANATAWAYLSLVSLHHRRQHEAEQAFRFALQKGLSDAALLAELKHTQAQVGFGNALVVQ